jgi:serine/threonine protein kinase
MAGQGLRRVQGIGFSRCAVCVCGCVVLYTFCTLYTIRTYTIFFTHAQTHSDVWAVGCAIYELVTREDVPIKEPFLGQQALGDGKTWELTVALMSNEIAQGLDDAVRVEGEREGVGGGGAKVVEKTTSKDEEGNESKSPQTHTHSHTHSQALAQWASVRAGIIELFKQCMLTNPRKRPELAEVCRRQWMRPAAGACVCMCMCMCMCMHMCDKERLCAHQRESAFIGVF